jgi:hypothetical protein
MTVVGVVGNVRTMFQAGDEPQIYVSSLQQNEPSGLLLVRPAGSTTLPGYAVKRAIWAAEPPPSAPPAAGLAAGFAALVFLVVSAV